MAIIRRYCGWTLLRAQCLTNRRTAETREAESLSWRRLLRAYLPVRARSPEGLALRHVGFLVRPRLVASEALVRLLQIGWALLYLSRR